MRLAKEQEERERAAIRFPDLAAAEARGPVPSGVRSYAGHAGGGSTMSERIDRAYQAKAAAQLAAAGKGGGRGGNSAASTGAGRVLRLDGKTGKVKVQTKVVKPSTASSSNGRGKATVVEETTAVLDAADDDDGFVPWIDANDDGVRGQLSVRSVDGETIAQRRRPEGRLFANVTLPEDEWPVWVPAASDETRLDDDDDDDLVNETGGEAAGRAVATNFGTNSDPRTASASAASNGAVPARAAVPGAVIPTDDGAKSKRRRGGKGAKEVKGKEGAGAAPS